jgi:putative oxidoreductase
MKVALIIVRVLMGLLFLVSVIGYFFNLMPQGEMGQNATLFVTGLGASGYLLPFVKGVELLVSLALLSGKFLPLAIVVIFPITINIFLFHAFLAPEGVAMSAFLFIGNIFMAYAYRKNYAGVLAVN